MTITTTLTFILILPLMVVAIDHLGAFIWG